jgi:DNA-binding beta-propeller fold protein YncE
MALPASNATEPPSAQQVQLGIEAIESEEAAREEELRSPEAAREREESRDAYVGLSTEAARQLLIETFPGQLARLNADPARLLSDVRIVKVFGETVATIESDGEGSLLEAGIPVRTENEAGDLEKVDLGLEHASSGLEPANPLVDLHIPDAAREPIAIGDEGLAVSVVDADEDAHAVGLGEENAFYPAVASDTDLLVAPTASGVELFDQLRSVDSPEALHFRLDLPEGAELTSSGGGGAEVVEGGDVVAFVAPPNAVDAQGSRVPVELAVQGQTITLRVSHRDRDFAYPILVDPAVSENYEAAWYWGSNTEALTTSGVWQYATNDPTEKWILHNTWCLRAELCSPSGRGLFLSSVSATMPANVYGQWYYTVPGATTFIPSIYPEPSATINPFWRHNYSCGWESYPHPHDYDGSFDAAGNWQWLETDRAQWYGNDVMFTKAKGIALGLSTGPGGSIPCWRNVMAGGVAVRLDDPEAPAITSVSGIPTGWLGASAQLSIVANAQDPGLGVRNATLSPAESPTLFDTPPQSECPGTKTHPCPATWAADFEIGSKVLMEGRKSVQISAYDPTGKTSATYEAETRVDRTAPGIDLSGQLAFVTDEDEGDGKDPELWDELHLPAYNLTVKATDGSNATPGQERSGVKNIQVFLDGKTSPESVPWEAQPCPQSSCSMIEDYSLKLGALAAGKHTLRVRAYDQLDQAYERSIEFEYIPATGITDEYVMQHFPLPDGKDHSGEEVSSGPELAVNLMNGNLVYRERDVDVEGYAADLEVERFYNSQLPAAENTEWGDGWTLAQTPDLDPVDTGGSPAPDEAQLLDTATVLDGQVDLPAEAGAEEFDPELHATITKKAAGGYELSDENGDGSGEIAFDPNGQAEKLLAGDRSSIDYDYEGGSLSEVAIEDPGATDLPPQEVVEEPYEVVTYLGSLGSYGTGNGQFKGPADVAVDGSGEILVADRGNNRIEVFDSEGNFQFKFGSAGSGNGQFSAPSGLAIDGNENILVADTGNSRIQKFSPAGAYLSKFGTYGTGNGQFLRPEGIAVGPEGEIWVADANANRLQEFDSSGKFLRKAGSSGNAPGQFGELAGIDTDYEGNVWAADLASSRVSVFDHEGQFIQRFGSYGSEEGQLKGATSVTIDPSYSEPHAWVGDRDNYRLQAFSATGEAVGQLGSQGSGPDQLGANSPSGAAFDFEQNLWVADTANNRLQEWDLPAEASGPQDDPVVEVEVDGGLVASLEGEESGEHTYEHDGDLLIAHDGPAGETQYGYDSSDRLDSVELANGTSAAIEYTADGRVKAVTVDPAGEPAAKSTHLEYSDEPRRTVVTPDGEPAVTYDIGPDGSVLRWWNEPVPPGFADLAGTLYEFRETAAPIAVGDQHLLVQARSEEGIESIQFVANGSTLVDEKACEQDFEEPGIECVEVTNEWVTNTANLAPGILPLEVIVTDRTGLTAAERFWVNIPQTPPPPNGAPAPPTFNEVLQFREEFGLDLDLDPNEEELALNGRILDLINAWHNPHTYVGEVARASWERWGVPLRPVDVAEMEYREGYIATDLPVIEEWAEANALNTYAGYYVDHPQGGVIHLGFTTNQTGTVASLKQQLDLLAESRIVPYASLPPTSESTLRSTLELVLDAWSTVEPLDGLITEVGLDEGDSMVSVGTSNVSLTEDFLDELLGAQAPIDFFYSSDPLDLFGRFKSKGRILAGDVIVGDPSQHGCTAGFGATEEGGLKPSGEPIVARFLLTAGHCFKLGESVKRPSDEDASNGYGPIGKVRRTAAPREHVHYESDGAAIRIEESAGLIPTHVYRNQKSALPVSAPARSHPGELLCTSGYATNKVKCGHVIGVRSTKLYNGRALQIKVRGLAGLHGDSGAPVWSPRTGASVGLFSGGKYGFKYVAPLIRPRAFSAEKAPGILAAPGMGNLILKLG